MARRSTSRPPARPPSTRAASSRRGGGRAAAAEKAQDSGPAIEDLLAILTTVTLVVAFLMIDAYRGGAFGTGLFFK